MAENQTNRSGFSEEAVSMFLGLLIVVVIIGLVFNYFQKRKGVIDLPGISSIQDQPTSVVGTVAPGGEPRETMASNRGWEYTVRSGDNLWEISENYYKTGYRWTEIAKLNKLTNAGLLIPGQKLVMPAVAVGQATAGENKILTGGQYKVIRGDSLWKIAVQSYGDGFSWTKIWQANRRLIADPNLIEIGMVLEIPK